MHRFAEQRWSLCAVADLEVEGFFCKTVKQRSPYWDTVWSPCGVDCFVRNSGTISESFFAAASHRGNSVYHDADDSETAHLNKNNKLILMLLLWVVYEEGNHLQWSSGRLFSY